LKLRTFNPIFAVIDIVCAPLPGASGSGEFLDRSFCFDNPWLRATYRLRVFACASPTGSNQKIRMAFFRLRDLSVEFSIYQGVSRSLKKSLVAKTTLGNIVRDRVTVLPGQSRSRIPSTVTVLPSSVPTVPARAHPSK
jgi:hypothetical protein